MKIKILVFILVTLVVATSFLSIYTYVNFFKLSTAAMNTSYDNSTSITNSTEAIVPASAPANDDIYAYSSKSCFLKTLYTAANGTEMYELANSDSKVLKVLSSNEPLIVYKDLGDFLYCEESEGVTGYVKKTSSFKKTLDYASDYLINVDLTNQNLKIYDGSNLIKQMLCSTGTFGNQNTETPLGKFKIQVRGKDFFNTSLNEGAKYYLQFFGDYLIHSTPVDENGKIIETEVEKLGSPVSHGCIRVSMEDAKWLYENVPDGGEVFIHY
ncbi:MAG: L,D-transpeptidase [Oscillospiraceae bacterium]|nr:L,D-transpeptidase [Oscillospiraceae bacterium]